MLEFNFWILISLFLYLSLLISFSLSPNLITLIGLSFVAVHVLLIWFWNPDMSGPSQRWLYFTSALGLWLYSTFDNVDGKQARRTHSSSPLGELFDHGCDALNCCVIF